MTKQSARAILTAVLLFFALGCTKDQIYRGLYEGTTTSERLKNPPGPNNDPPSYEQYEIQRKEKEEKDKNAL